MNKSLFLKSICGFVFGLVLSAGAFASPEVNEASPQERLARKQELQSEIDSVDQSIQKIKSLPRGGRNYRDLGVDARSVLEELEAKKKFKLLQLEEISLVERLEVVRFQIEQLKPSQEDN